MTSIVKEFVKFNAQTASKDRLLRLVQYASRLCSYYELFSKLSLSELEKATSSSRKAIRLAKWVDFILACKTTVNLSNPILKSTLTINKLCMAVYLFCDNLAWLIKTLNIKTSTDWAKRSSRFWLTALIFNLLRDFYELCGEFSKCKKNGGNCGHFMRKNMPLILDLIKNACDVLLPLASLGYFNNVLHRGATGSLGVITSLVGILIILQPALKLSP